MNGIASAKGREGNIPSAPFWETTPLHKLTRGQWESLCDGCGRCCLQKLENKKTGKVFYTCVSCYLLDTHQCRCRDYPRRHELVRGCIRLSPQNVYRIKWLPRSCAYRTLAEERNLAWWHPLVSGNPDTVHAAGISVRNLAVSETMVHPDHLEDYIVENQSIF